jgi:tetratricopeptide (TPR) repeat protein
MADDFQGAAIAAAVVARLRAAGVAASIRELPPWPSRTPEVGTAICVDIAGAPRPIALAETWGVRAAATFKLGWVAAQEDRWDDALVLFSRAAELDPAGAAPRTNEAWALGRLGRWSEALAILDALAQRSPDFAEAHRNRGWVLRNLGRLEEATTACERALALSPTYASGLHEAGLVAMSQQRWDDAVAYLERAVALAPTDTVIAAALVAARTGKA